MADEIKYTTGMVTFLDLLGFRELLHRKSPAELAKLMDIFRENGNPKTDWNDEFDQLYSYAALSDCFFRATNVERAAGQNLLPGHLFHELLSIVHIQYRLIQEGLLIRGALTYGQYYDQNDKFGSVLFGPAVSYAYELESKAARFPRVVVDAAVIDQYWSTDLLKAREHARKLEWERYISQLLRRDDSGIWFVDYLRGMRGEFDDEPEGTGQFYLGHKHFIEKRLSDWVNEGKKTLDSIGEKLLWLSEYHNSTMSHLTGDDWKSLLSPEDCKLSPKDFFVSLPNHPIFNQYPPRKS